MKNLLMLVFVAVCSHRGLRERRNC